MLRPGRRMVALAAGLAVTSTMLLAGPAAQAGNPPLRNNQCIAQTCPDTVSLTTAQKSSLMQVARDTWKYFVAADDPHTHLPMDNIGFNGAPQGHYTSPTNLGVNLWSIAAAADMGLISRREEHTRLNRALTAIEKLQKWNGFLLSWYSTTTGQAVDNPGQPTEMPVPIGYAGELISSVDNGWYGAGLVITRQADPALARRASALLAQMNYSQFYDKANQATDPNGGQLYGGWIVGQGPATFEYGMINTETRIVSYVGIGTHTLPGDAWWRTWRTEPAQYGQEQTPVGPTVTVTDPLSHKKFQVVEGHYTYDGIDYAPSWGGSAFEGLMPNLVVPETKYGRRSFGANDQNYTKAMIAWTTNEMGYPVWGLSPSSTPDDTGGYAAYGATALATGGSCCAYETGAVTPHASFLALDTLPQSAFRNITNLRKLYPDIYGPEGFFDSVDPKTGSVGHRYLILDQAMILASLDNALTGSTMQRRWAADPVGQVDIKYLQAETFSVPAFVPPTSGGGHGN